MDGEIMEKDNPIEESVVFDRESVVVVSKNENEEVIFAAEEGNNDDINEGMALHISKRIKLSDPAPAPCQDQDQPQIDEDEIRKIKIRIKAKEEKLRQLNLVQLYKSKWKIEELETLTIKWKAVSIQAFEYLYEVWKNEDKAKNSMPIEKFAKYVLKIEDENILKILCGSNKSCESSQNSNISSSSSSNQSQNYDDGSGSESLTLSSKESTADSQTQQEQE